MQVGTGTGGLVKLRVCHTKSAQMCCLERVGHAKDLGWICYLLGGGVCRLGYFMEIWVMFRDGYDFGTRILCGLERLLRKERSDGF